MVMNQEIKEQLEEITKKLNGKLTYYFCSDLKTQHQKLEIIYDMKTK
jgi:YHS domain-containing protein